MNTLEKLYLNTRIEKRYPELTKDKLFDLLDFMSKLDQISHVSISTKTDNKRVYLVQIIYNSEELKYHSSYCDSLKEGISNILNQLWYDLSSEQQLQIQNILNT